MTEKEKYLARYKDQQENHGLQYTHVSLSDNPNINEEDIYKELNLINELVAKGQVNPLPFSDRQLDDETYCGEGCECYKNPETNQFDKKPKFNPRVLPLKDYSDF